MSKKQLRIITATGAAKFHDLNSKDTGKAVQKYLKVLQQQNARAFLIFEKV